MALAERGAQGADEKPLPSTAPRPLGSPCPPALIPSGEPILPAWLSAGAVLGVSAAPRRSLSALPAEDHFSDASCYSWNRVQVPWV